jgi:hypothetical protein
VTTTRSYRPVPYWAHVPHGITFNGDATSVAVDSEDRVYVFNRGTLPIVIFERTGEFVDAWGEGEFDRAHAIHVDDEDNLFLVDTGGHFVQKRTPEGKVLFTIGVRGSSEPLNSGRHFNLPTDVVIHPVTKDLFVTDGYGNSRVHQFDHEGQHIRSWGEMGTEPGQFNLPHNVELIDDEHLLVCDRENFRMQIFTTAGEYAGQWHAHRPSAVCAGPDEGVFVLGELSNRHLHGIVGGRVRLCSSQGAVLASLGRPEPGFEADQFFAPHGLAVDSFGAIYVAEVNRTLASGFGFDPPRGEMVSLRKWEPEPSPEPA